MKPSNDQRLVLPERYWRLRPLQFVVTDIHDWLLPFMAVNLLWVLFSLTVILLPPAIAALHEVVYQSYHGVPPNPIEFIHRLKYWFFTAWRWAIANILFLSAAFLLGRILFANEVLLAVIATVVAFAFIVQFYFWSYVLIQEEPHLLRALRNSVFTAFGGLMYLTVYILITVLILIPAVITIAPLLLIVPTVIAMLSIYSLIGWLQHHQLLKSDERLF